MSDPPNDPPTVADSTDASTADGAERSAQALDAYLGRFSNPTTRRTMASALRQLADLASDGAHDERSFPWWTLRGPCVAKLREALASRGSETTANRYLAALRGVLHACRSRGWLTEDDQRAALAAARTLPLRRGQVAPIPRPAMRALRTACGDGTITGLRDAVVITLLLLGVTSPEIVALLIDDWDEARLAFQIRGRGRRMRLALLDSVAAATITAWIRVRGREPGPFVTPVHRRSARARIGPLRPVTIDAIVRRRAKLVGLRHLGADELRRRALALHATVYGADMIRGLAGHARRRTTARYLPR